MKKRMIIAAVLLMAAAVAYSGVRTVVFMQKETVTGQFIFIKGGHDAGLVPNVYPAMGEPIQYCNLKNPDSYAIKTNDLMLDWGSESALDWTCNVWPTSWGTKKTYAVNGYGEDPENTYGLHYWKFDVFMDGKAGDWFEFKAFMRQGTSDWWENNIAQTGTPYATINHWGKKGYKTVVSYGGNAATFVLLNSSTSNVAPDANFIASPTSGVVNVTTFNFDASASYDQEDGANVQVRWDYDNNGTFETAWSTDKTGSYKYTTTGTKTVKLEVKDTTGLVSSKTLTVTVNSTAPADFRSETIYFLITTRFYDGDPANNYYNRDRVKAGDPHWRGDFKGLIAKLDYIKDLGFTAIWITPPVENRSGLDYHGYHAYDWTKVDPRYESVGATYQDLINAAHAKGLKIVQDVVINHSCNYGIRGKVWINRLPIKYYRPAGVLQTSTTWSTAPYGTNLGCYKKTYREDNDNPVAPQWFKDRVNTDAPGWVALVDPLTGQTVVPGYNPNRFFGIDYGVCNADPTFTTWYHTSGFMSGGDWESPIALQQKSMAGDCIDLNTENSTVRTYINNAIRQYLAMGVDAIRLDTVKHLERGDLLSYVNNWKAYKPNLFVFGENLVKGTGWGDLGGDNGPSDIRPWWYTRLGASKTDPNSGGDSGFSVLDFSLFSTFRDNVSKGSYGGIGGILAMDWVYGDATKLVTFLQNHDVGPDNDFKYRYKGDQWMAAATYNMLWTIRGIPCLYYGEEVEFMKGAPQDISGNTDTIDTTGRAYFGDKIATASTHPIYQHIKRLNQIRKAIPALQKAPMQNVNEWGSGMSFVRDYNNGESYVVVGLAMGGGQTINVGGVRNGTYRDCVTGNTIEVGNGNISFFVQGNSAGIWVLNGPGKIGTTLTYLR